MGNVLQNALHLEERMNDVAKESGRKRSDFTVVVVSKNQAVTDVLQLYQAGYRHFGENRLEGLVEKQEALKDCDITWHFIGSLQTRKVKDVLPLVSYVHALDRLSLAKEINKRATKQTACFVQVNVSGEASKSGVSPLDVQDFVESLAAFPMIQVVGLMTMAPFEATKEELHQYFRTLKDLQKSVEAKNWAHAPCRETSMGMSNDYQIAIKEGATMLRVGSSFFHESDERTECR